MRDFNIFALQNLVANGILSIQTQPKDTEEDREMQQTMKRTYQQNVWKLSFWHHCVFQELYDSVKMWKTAGRDNPTVVINTCVMLTHFVWAFEGIDH